MPSLARAKAVRGAVGCPVSPNTRLSPHNPLPTRRQLSPPSGLSHAPLPTVATQIVKLPVMAVSSNDYRHPPKAGVQCNRCNPRRPWIPAFAGMTAESVPSRAIRSVLAFPAGVRDADDDAVRARPFLLEIGMAAVPHHRGNMVFGGQPLAARGFDVLAGRVEVVDLNSQMVTAGKVGSVRSHV